MRQFKDVKGREWSITIDVAAIRRVRTALGIDLMDLAGGDLADKLLNDPVTLADVLAVLCEGMDPAALFGQVLDDAATALLRELLDFFPSGPRARAIVKLRAAMDAQAAALAAASSDPAADPSSPATPGGLSGNSPASSALTPQG